MGQQAIQISLTTVWVLFASPIANAITPEWWYGLGSVLSGLLLVVALALLPETKYNRSLSSYQETDSTDGFDATSQTKVSRVTMCTERPQLDFVQYSPRTWRSDMRLWIGKPEWIKVWDVFRVSFPISRPTVMSTLTVNKANIRVAPFSKRLLGSSLERTYNRCQHCYRHNIQHYPVQSPIQMAQQKR